MTSEWQVMVVVGKIVVTCDGRQIVVILATPYTFTYTIAIFYFCFLSLICTDKKTN